MGARGSQSSLTRFAVDKYVVNKQWQNFDSDIAKPQTSVPKAGLARSADQQEVLAFWISICENAAASEVVVNLFLPYVLCDVRSGELHAPSDFVLNSLVLILNFASAYLEGFTKSTRLLTQSMRKTRSTYQLVFVLSHGFSIGFLNVSSSFPDVGGGGSDVALGTGSIMAGSMFVLLNMIGSIVLYKVGRTAGWRCMKNRWKEIVRFTLIWPTIVRVCILASFVLVILGPPCLGHDLPLDLGDPEMGGIEDVRFIYDGYMINLPRQPLGLAFGILMSTLGCIAATLLCDIWLEDQHRPAARLVANFLSTVVILVVQYWQNSGDQIGFMLMKFSSSFCGALSAFSSTIGDVYDECFGVAEEESSYDKPIRGPKPARAPWISGLQNFVIHWLLTMAIMLFDFVTEPVELPPIVLDSRPRHFANETLTVSWISGLHD